MKVAFLTNYEKTTFFHGVATRLEAAGHEVAWISPGQHWARWLVAHGVRPDRVLDLSAHADAWHGLDADADDRRELATLEAAAGVHAHDLLLMDRVIRPWPAARALRYPCRLPTAGDRVPRRAGHPGGAR
ncbi:MAG: hypothetical protein R2939_02065 [Kofleriaceae bacterium]